MSFIVPPTMHVSRMHCNCMHAAVASRMPMYAMQASTGISISKACTAQPQPTARRHRTIYQTASRSERENKKEKKNPPLLRRLSMHGAMHMHMRRMQGQQGWWWWLVK
jgi:hypothetical protein